MRIDCIITRESAGSTSGAWLSLERLCRQVAVAGHRIDVVTWPEVPPPGPRGAAEMASRLRTSCLVFAATLEQRWRVNRPDVVHVELAGNVGQAARDTAQRLGLAVSSAYHHIHLYAPEEQQQRIRRLTAAFHTGCQVTVAQSPASRDLLLSMGGPEAVIIPDGVDAQVFAPGRRDSGIRTSWQAVPDTPVILWAGRMVATKGLDLMAEAASAVHTQRPAVRFVFAGDGPEAASLRARLPWAHLCGMLGGDAMAVAYASADIFAFSSPDEPWGNALLEAAASSLAIVARSGGAAEEVLRPAGACVDPLPRDLPAFTVSLLRLIDDAAERRRLGLAARRAAEGASIEACAARWLELWAGLSRRGTPS